MSASTQDDASLPIEHRIRMAYTKARMLEGAPVDLLDREFQNLQARLSRATHQDWGSMNGPQRTAAEQTKVRLLQEGEQFFVRWGGMSSRELVGELAKLQQQTFPPPTPEQSARQLIGMLEGVRGVRLELWHKSFRVVPAAKLSETDRAQLQAMKVHVLAELQRRSDAWTPD